jgi:hypothetical protein
MKMGKMRPPPGWRRGIKENGGGEFNYDIL